MTKGPYIKPFLLLQGQMAQLKSRGMKFVDEAKALHLLKNIGYYRFSGYWYPLMANRETPKDIIRDGVCGYLVNTEEQMSEKIIAYLGNADGHKAFRKAAVKRAKDYNADGIIERFVADVGLKD